MSILFFDMEVFKFNWLVVFIDPVNRSKTVIVDDVKTFTEFYETHKSDVWIGHNAAAYDKYIAQGILCGFNPYEINNWIIKRRRQGWEFSSLLRQYPLNIYDTMKNIGSMPSLKKLEAFMGNNIEESSVPFDIDRPLTVNEINETIKYCTHDVEQTAEVFIQTIEMFQSHMGLIKTFGLPLSYLSKTQTQLAALILGASRRSYNDEFDVSIPDTLILDKYTEVLDFFRNAKHDTRLEMMVETQRLKSKYAEKEAALKAWKELKSSTKKAQTEITKLEKWFKEYPKLLDAADWNNADAFRKWFYNRKLEITVAGIPHIFAWGGVHGASDKPYVDIGRFIMADVASLYPSLMIRYGYYSRSMSDPQRYKQIYETNLEMKRTKDPQRPAYKLVCNKTYGALKDPYNPLFDPLQANNICVAGQLLLLDLIEKLEDVCTLIQSNTDGILIKIESDTDFEAVKEIVSDWEQRTGLVMEFSEFDRVIQKDVNNYIIISKNGKCKAIGAYVKGLCEIDNDLPIVNKAINDYLINGIHPETTVLSCNDLKQFQKVVKVSSKYAYAMYGGKRLTEKTFRVFASKRLEDGKIYKVKSEKSNPEKFANTPDNCFIENGNVSGVSCPDYLDKDYYVNMAINRIKDFGVKI